MDSTLLGCSGSADAHAAEGTNSVMLIVVDGEPPACDIDKSNTSEDDCSAQDGGPPIQPTVQPDSQYDGTGRTHESNDCEMVCEMQAPELCHTADTTQPTSHEMMVCDGTTLPDAKVSDEFNATGTCEEHAFVHDNTPDAETSLPREEQTYTADVHKDIETYATEQNNTSTGQETTTKIDSDTSCQYADLHGSSRTNDPCTTYEPEDIVVGVAGYAGSAAVNNVRQDDAGAFDITQEVVYINDNHSVFGAGHNTSVCEGALESSDCMRRKGSERANEALCGTNSITQVSIGNVESNREGTAVIDEVNQWCKALIRSEHGLSLSFAVDIAESFHAGGFMRRGVLQFALDYIREYKASKTTKILGPEVGEALVSKVVIMPESARRLFTSESKDVLDKYSFVMIPFPDWHDADDTGMNKHYVLVVIDFIDEKFKIFDSGRNPTDKKLREITVKVVHSIKNTWVSGLGQHPNVRSLNNFEFEFTDMPKYTHAQDGAYLMLQMIETIEFDEYRDFTGADAENLRMLWMCRLFGEVNAIRVKFDVLASYCKGDVATVVNRGIS
ncbi:hypothetical protein ACQ4PT_000624 [Festuca glaucescens]